MLLRPLGRYIRLTQQCCKCIDSGVDVTTKSMNRQTVSVDFKNKIFQDEICSAKMLLDSSRDMLWSIWF